MNWPCARIFFFERDKSDLILGGIAPAIEAWRSVPGAAPVWLRSHWRLGPHVDVIADMPDAEFDDQLLPLIEQHVGGWMANNSSLAVLDEHEYAALSKRLAITELESGALGPLGANNTIVRAQHQPNLDIFGVREILEGQHRFQALSVSAVIDALRLRRKDEARLFLRLAEMLALTGNFVPKHGLPRSFISFRAHADYVFANYDPSGAVRERFDATDAAFQEEVDTIVAAAHAVYLGERDVLEAFPHLAGWYNDARGLSIEVYAVAERNAEILGRQNRLSGLADEIVASQNVVLDPAKARKDSETEKYIGDMQSVFQQVPHIAYRTMVNYLYGLLPILSVSPMQKYLICHMVAKSCERVFEKSWRNVVDEGRILQGAAA